MDALVLFLVPIFILVPFILDDYLRNDKKSLITLGISACIPVINWIAAAYVVIHWLFTDYHPMTISGLSNKFNSTKICCDCGIHSKRGRTLIHKQFNGTKEICPFCGSDDLTHSDKGAPISKKLGFFECLQLQRKINLYYNLKDTERDLIFKDKQLGKYQDLQRKKLEHMLQKQQEALIINKEDFL